MPCLRSSFGRIGREGLNVSANELPAKPEVKDIPLLHVHFGGREALLRWLEKDAEEAGMAPEDRVLWLVEVYRDGVEEG